MLLPRPLANAVIVLISLVWAANFFLQFLIAGYEPDPAIHGVFGAIVGGAFALSRRDGQDRPPPPRTGDWT
jgi:hypothetical protein